MTLNERTAHICLADPGRGYQGTLYSTRWVDRCIEEQRLLDHAVPEFQLRVAPSLEKIPFTVEEDQVLRLFVKAKKAAGAGISGDIIYKEFAAEASSQLCSRK